ncbi:hypothetical protein KSS87_007386, partial [Heliosperma pusillum]
MQTMGNEARKTHCSHKELQCKQWVMKHGRLIVHTRSYNETMGKNSLFTQGFTMQTMGNKAGRLIVH